MSVNTNRKRLNVLEIADAHIFSTNFAGLEKVNNGQIVNGEGNRTFCVNIPDVMVTTEEGVDIPLGEAMINDGWKVKPHRNDENSYYLPVRVRFDKQPPNIWLIVGKRRTAITEDMVDTLDGRTFEKVDLLINPSVRTNWSTGETKVTAYLEEGWFYMRQSSFARAWDEENCSDDYDEETPF